MTVGDLLLLGWATLCSFSVEPLTSRFVRFSTNVSFPSFLSLDLEGAILRCALSRLMSCRMIQGVVTDIEEIRLIHISYII